MKKILKVLKIIIVTYLIYIVVFGLLIFKWPTYIKSSINYDVNELLTPTDANSYAYLVEGTKEAFDIRLSLILKAKKSIDLTYYKFKDDKAGEIFSGALLKKADQGIKITIIVDGTRSYKNLLFKTLATHKNITLQIYEPLSPIFIMRSHNVLHDKILLIDENFGLIGGRNIENRFLLEDSETITLDRDVLVYSSEEKSEVGIEMKNYINELKSSKYVKTYQPKYKNSFNSYKNELINKYLDFSLLNEYNLDLKLNEKGIKVDKVSFIRSPLNRGTKEPVLFNVINDLITAGDDIVIQSPYITKSYLMKKNFQAFDDKNITFLTNNLETNPNMFGLSGYIRIRKTLAKNYTLYESQKENAIHAKTITIDQDISIVGSQNIDHRSFFLSTESVVIIVSSDFQKELNKKINNIIADSLLVKSNGNYEPKENIEPIKRSTYKKIKLKLASWFSPLFSEMLFKQITIYKEINLKPLILTIEKGQLILLN